jgi:hypothetical protein
MARRDCFETAAPLETVYKRFLTSQPTEPKVFISGAAIGASRAPGRFLSPALYDLELDADLVRIAVRDIKSRCWGWFGMRQGIYGEEPSGEDAKTYHADERIVQGSLAHINRLNKIADMLDAIAQRHPER